MADQDKVKQAEALVLRRTASPLDGAGAKRLVRDLLKIVEPPHKDKRDRYQQIRDALADTAAEALRAHAEYVKKDNFIVRENDPTYNERTARAAQIAMSDPGLIMGLIKRLFPGESEEE